MMFDEFLNIMARRMKDTDTDEELRQGFKIFDADGDNQISIDDLRTLMLKLGETLSDEELKDMISVASSDRNESDMISFDEFTEVLQPK